jgi:prevent-host-death family protein
VGTYDAKSHFSELLDRVESGEEITITKHGKPVARPIPVKKVHTRKNAARRSNAGKRFLRDFL